MLEEKVTKCHWRLEGIIWLWLFYSNISQLSMKFWLFLRSKSSQSSMSNTPPRWGVHHRFLYSGLSVLFSKSEVEIKPFHFPVGLMKTLMLAGAALWRALPITPDSIELNSSKKLLNTMPWHIAHKNLCIAIKIFCLEHFLPPLVSWLTKCYFWVFICVGSRACYGVDLHSLWLHIHPLSGNTTQEKSVITAHECLNELSNRWAAIRQKQS